jgi:hypothetical protein
MDRARQAELLEAVTAGPLEGHFVAVASGRLIDDLGNAETVDRNESVDVGVIAEQGPDAPEIAEFFLADGADEHHVADGCDGVFVQRLDHREQRGQTAGIIADSGRKNGAVLFLHGHVGPFGEDGVEMGRDHELRPAVAAAFAQRDHIALGIDRGVLEAELDEALEKIFGPLPLLVGRRGNFRDAFLFGKGVSVIGLDVLKRLDHLWVGENGLRGGVNRRSRARRLCGGRHRPRARQQQHTYQDRSPENLHSRPSSVTRPASPHGVPRPAALSRWENQSDNWGSNWPATYTSDLLTLFFSRVKITPIQ